MVILPARVKNNSSTKLIFFQPQIRHFLQMDFIRQIGCKISGKIFFPSFALALFSSFLSCFNSVQQVGAKKTCSASVLELIKRRWKTLLTRCGGQRGALYCHSCCGHLRQHWLGSWVFLDQPCSWSSFECFLLDGSKYGNGYGRNIRRKIRQKSIKRTRICRLKNWVNRYASTDQLIAHFYFR